VTHPSSEVPAGHPSECQRPSDQQLLTTLFDLGRQVTSVLDLDELLQRIPQLISRLTDYQAFAVYLIDESAATSPSRTPSATRPRRSKGSASRSARESSAPRCATSARSSWTT